MRKKLQFIFCVKLKILTCLVLLLIPLLSNAQFIQVPEADDYTDGDYDRFWAATIVGNRVYITASIGDQDSSSEDDVMDLVRISVNNTQVFEITNERRSSAGTLLVHSGPIQAGRDKWFYTESNGFVTNRHTEYQHDNNEVAFFSLEV